MLLSALAQLSACLIVWNFHIPNPNILLFVVLSAALVKCGYAAGIVSGLIAFLYSAFFFSTDHSFFLYTSLNLQKLIVIGLGIAANILLIGHLQRQFEHSNMEKMQAEAEEKLQETTESYRAKLYQDVLTGTYNRRYYEDIASRMVGPAGIALMDVDDFKICNDTYGHHAGDVALKTVASAIQSCIRSSDLLIRYGGDEFLLVLPGIPSDILQAKLEQIRAAVQQSTVPGYSHFRLSLSIGGTMQAITDPMENAVRRADWLMYQAKGRKNAVMVEVPGHSLAALEKLLQNKSQILLVDDSAMNRMMLAEILGDSYHILEAENGRECLETLQAEAGNIALVLLDINMPVMDGFEVLKAMNANHTIEDIPVIMISSDDSDAAIRRSYELGASDYVNRPFDARIVYRRVTNTIKLYAKPSLTEPSLILIIPIISIVTMLFSTWLSTKLSSGSTGSSAKQMLPMMAVSVIMFGVFSFIYPAGFSLYWSMGNVIMILQSLILRKIVDPEKIAAEVKQQIEASQKTKKTKEKVMTVTQDGVTKQVVVKGSELDKMRLLRARERDASRYDD